MKIHITLLLLALTATMTSAQPTAQRSELTPDILRALGLADERILIESPHVWTLTGDYTVYSSRPYASDIYGYQSTTPVFIAVRNNTVVAIAPADNKETPKLFARAATILDQWKGLSLRKAVKLTPDAVSGATMSSQALSRTVQTTLRAIRDNNKAEQRARQNDAHTGATGR